MLHTQPDRGERILDLVRHLPRHLTPRQDPFGASYLDSAQLQIPR
jgi:hypothetical protein